MSCGHSVYKFPVEAKCRSQLAVDHYWLVMLSIVIICTIFNIYWQTSLERYVLQLLLYFVDNQLLFYFWDSRFFVIFFVIIIIINRTSSTVQSGENKYVYKLISQLRNHLRQGKLKKTQREEAINSWLHPLTHSAFRYQTQCRERHSTIEPEPAGKT